jgi:hypothetical protein
MRKPSLSPGDLVQNLKAREFHKGFIATSLPAMSVGTVKCLYHMEYGEWVVEVKFYGYPSLIFTPEELRKVRLAAGTMLDKGEPRSEIFTKMP